jgi:ADP-ribosylglycohydrolase
MASADKSILFDKIHGSMLWSAVGDAMGGPVEGLDYHQIQAEYGVVDSLLPYHHPPDFHYHFHNDAGTITDDTRLKMILCQAILNCGDILLRGDFLKALTVAYFRSEKDLELGFLEEYVLGGVYGEDKLIWGGQPTNGFIMANSPLGLVCPCDPLAAFKLSFDLDFISDGYARYSAAMAAAAVSAAMRPGATVESVIKDTLDVAHVHRREGDLTRHWNWYEHVFLLNERLIKIATQIAAHHRDVLAVRAEFYEQLNAGPLGSEAAQSLAVAIGMLVAAKGDPIQTIIGCVNYGRDNDSYAAIGGSIAGALHGTESLPLAWRQGVEQANPEIDFYRISLSLAHVVARKQEHLSHTVNQVDELLRR